MEGAPAIDLHQVLQDISVVESEESLDQLRVHYLGKQGVLTQCLKTLGRMDPKVRSQMGSELNQKKQAILSAIEDKRHALIQAKEALILAKEREDVTMPGAPKLPSGSRHPTSLAEQRLTEILSQFGFQAVEGPEIENDYYNFTALNVGPWHPARAMHDTFYLPNDRLLRTHTSSVQIRVLEEQGVPIRIMAPGRVYRCDSDQTHTPMFHQMEGLVVDEHCSFAEMVTVLKAMLSSFFEKEVEMRLRPSYFPFTEPSYEMDVRWSDQDPWLEVLGCGMVHPDVLQRQGLDTQKYRGYAFGLGIDRFAMLKYGIEDLRMMFENHISFISQF